MVRTFFGKAMALWMIFFLFGCEKLLKEEESVTADLGHEDHDHGSTESYYTCSMHPQIRSDKPGKCPICFMNLTKVEVETGEDMVEAKADEAAVAELWQCKDFPDVTSEVADTCPLDGTPMVKVQVGPSPGDQIAKIKLKKSQRNHFKPAYFPVTQMKMSKKIRLLGTVVQSEERESNIPARIGGRVEKVFVKSTGSRIERGDPVVTLYSPQLITAGEEYILARRNLRGNRGQTSAAEFRDLLAESEKRLKLWGIKPSQYEQWFNEGKVPRAITIYSNASGVVRKRNALPGKYFKEGENFFELSDLADIWVEMDVYEHDAALVKLGQAVQLEFAALPGRKWSGDIDFVNPVLDPTSRTLKVRTTVNNPEGRLMPGMVADATLAVSLGGLPLVVPRSAIIDTGERKVVWVKVNDRQFQAKLVETGLESEGYVEILSGLMEGEQVVVEGSFLLDAQAQLFGGYEDFQTAADNSQPHQHH